jgi:ribonuclease HII
MKEHIVCGIDEAGRGPVIGPLVLACVVVDAKGADKLRKLNVKDSKKLMPARREHLEPLIKALSLEWRTSYITPQDIDRLRKSMSLNLIEAQRTAEMIVTLTKIPSKIIVDAADSVQENYGKRIVESILALNPKYRMPEMVSEHKADDNYVEVSAASVLAKVARDMAIEELKAELGDFGSGYPSDPRTQEFIKGLIASGDIPDCVRRSWNTMDRGKQTSMGEYL